MSKKDNCSKKSDKPKKEIYILQATYKDNDPEIVGAYDSMHAMMRGFAKLIASEVEDDNRNATPKDLVRMVAVALADLMPAFFSDDFPRDEEDCIRYGNTTYGYEVLEMESVDSEGGDTGVSGFVNLVPSDILKGDA